MSEVLGVRGLRRSFRQANVTIDVLRGVDLAIRAGEIVALLGPSGSGKSTLLQAVGLLEGGFEGSIMIQGREAAAFNDAERTAMRRDTLGFVYQFHHLLPDFTALENVVIPQLVKGASRAEANARAQSLLTGLGLAERLTHRPSKLSGGEQQRVAVARAVAKRPGVLLCDEPTGALDSSTGIRVLETLERAHNELGTTVIIITHNVGIAAMAHRVIHFRDGQIARIDVNEHPIGPEKISW